MMHTESSPNYGCARRFLASCPLPLKTCLSAGRDSSPPVCNASLLHTPIACTGRELFQHSLNPSPPPENSPCPPNR